MSKRKANDMSSNRFSIDEYNAGDVESDDEIDDEIDYEENYALDADDVVVDEDGIEMEIENDKVIGTRPENATAFQKDINKQNSLLDVYNLIIKYPGLYRKLDMTPNEFLDTEEYKELRKSFVSKVKNNWNSNSKSKSNSKSDLESIGNILNLFIENNYIILISQDDGVQKQHEEILTTLQEYHKSKKLYQGPFLKEDDLKRLVPIPLYRNQDEDEDTEQSNRVVPLYKEKKGYITSIIYDITYVDKNGGNTNYVKKLNNAASDEFNTVISRIIPNNQQLNDLSGKILAYVLKPEDKDIDDIDLSEGYDNKRVSNNVDGSQGVYENYKCTEIPPARTENDVLEHQEKLRKKILDSFKPSAQPIKRLLFYHTLGSGKTCTAIFIADALLNLYYNKEKKNRDMTNGIKHVYVFTPASLRTSWVREYCLKCGISNDILSQYYTFITLNMSISAKQNVQGNRPIDSWQINKFDYKNSLVIVDEVQMMISMIRNGSPLGLHFYDKIKDAKYLFLLTGTPITACSSERARLEYYIYMSLLVPEIGLIKPVTELVDAMKKVTDNTNKADDDELEEKVISGLKVVNDAINVKGLGNPMPLFVSYYSPQPSDVTVSNYNILVQVSDAQSRAIYRAIYTENKIANTKKPRNAEAHKSEKMLARMKMYSRRESNCINQDVTVHNWDELWIFSAKYCAILNNIDKLITKKKGRKHVLYTNFIGGNGAKFLVNLFKKFFGDAVHVELYYGKLNQNKRDLMLQRFNKPQSRGGPTRILVISTAGMLGLNIMGTNYLHIVDSHYNETQIEQLKGRIIRYKSHDGLSQDDQFVTIYRYMSFYTQTQEDEAKGNLTVLANKKAEAVEKLYYKILNKLNLTNPEVKELFEKMGKDNKPLYQNSKETNMANLKKYLDENDHKVSDETVKSANSELDYFYTEKAEAVEEAVSIYIFSKPADENIDNVDKNKYYEYDIIRNPPVNLDNFEGTDVRLYLRGKACLINTKKYTEELKNSELDKPRQSVPALVPQSNYDMEEDNPSPQADFVGNFVDILE